MSDSSAFNGYGIKDLKKMVIAKAQEYEASKKDIVLDLVDKMKEKEVLVRLVARHVSVDEVDKLLASNVSITSASSASNSSGNGKKPKKKLSKQEKENIRNALGGGSGGRDMPGQPSPDMLRKQAREIRRNPDALRRANPAFAKMTGKEINAYADQMEAAAKDPKLLEQMMQMSQMPDADKQSMMLIQEGLTGKRERDEKWVEAAVKQVKGNPGLLKMLFKGKLDPKAGLSEEQIEGFIDYIVTWSDSTLIFVAGIINYLASQSDNIAAYYKKADEMTLGCAKWILLALVIFIVYMLSRFAWYIIVQFVYLAMSGYSMVMGTGGATTKSGEAGSNSANTGSNDFFKTDQAKAGDEF